MRIQVLADQLMVHRARAFETALGDECTERAPTTILLQHPNTTVYLHNASSARLAREPLAPFDAILPS